MHIENTNTKVNEFIALITQGIECWNKAGEIVVSLLDEQQMTTAEIANCSEYLTEDIVTRFEQLGRKQLIPRLLIADYPAAKHLVRLPYSEQKRLVDGSVDLLVSDSETLKVSVQNLSSSQCKQVFEKNHVRSIGAQRAFLEEKKTINTIRNAVTSFQDIYLVKGKKVVFCRPCEMTAGQLAQIISEIEAK
jgi:hypothetical protein